MARPRKTKASSIFSTNLKRVLEERQLSLKVASDLMGIPYTTLTDWANGASPSDIEAIGRFCTKLGIDFTWLMLGEKGNANFSEVPLEAIFNEEPDASFEGIYKIRAVKMTRRNGGS